MKKTHALFLILPLTLIFISGCNSDTTNNTDTTVPQTQTQQNSQTQTVAPSSVTQTQVTANITTSRAAMNGCTWELFDASAIGLKFPLQKCDKVPFTYKAEENAIVQYVNGKKDYKSIEVFKKKSTQTPENSLKEEFIKKLSAKEQKNCVVKEDTQDKKNTNETLYSIVPNDQYFNELKKANDGPFSACGDYGFTNDGIQYFLFKKDKPTMFAFVRVGQDEPLFDEQNITFVGK